jgi:hypothetical protein
MKGLEWSIKSAFMKRTRNKSFGSLEKTPKNPNLLSIARPSMKSLVRTINLYFQSKSMNALNWKERITSLIHRSTNFLESIEKI